MSEIALLKFMFNEPWKTLSDALALNKPYEADDYFNAQEVCTFLAGNPVALIVASLKNRDDFIQIASMIKLSKKLNKDIALRVVVFNFSGEKQYEKALNKLGVSDVLDSKINPKALRFKIDFCFKALNAQYRTVLAKAGNADKTTISSSEGAKSSSGVSDEVKVNGAITWTEPLECKDDIWLIKSSSDCKKVLSKWVIKLTGPGPYAGQWNEVKGKAGLWRFEIKKEDSQSFLPDNGIWVFKGSQKPDFIWNENLWLVSGDEFELSYQGKTAKLSRFKLENKLMSVAKNSQYALKKESMILESFNKELLVKADDNLEATDRLEGEEADKISNLKGKIKDAENRGSDLLGKSKAEEAKDGHLKGKAKSEPAINGELSGKVKNDQISQDNLDGKTNGEGAIPSHYSNQNKSNGKQLEKSNDDLFGDIKNKEKSSDQLQGKIKSDHIKDPNLAGKNKPEDALSGHYKNQEKNINLEKKSGGFPDKMGKAEESSGPLHGKIKSDSINDPNLSGKNKPEDAIKGHYDNKNNLSSNKSPGPNGKNQFEEDLKDYSDEEEKSHKGDDVASSGQLAGKIKKEEAILGHLSKPRKNSEQNKSFEDVDDKYLQNRASGKNGQGKQLSLEDDNIQVEKYLKNHNVPEEFKGKKGLGGKGHTDHIDNKLSSIQENELSDPDKSKPFANVIPFKHKKNDWENEIDPEMEAAIQDAQLSFILTQGYSKFECQLDDQFDNTIIFKTQEKGIDENKRSMLDLSFNYLGSEKKINFDAKILSIDSDDEGCYYITAEIPEREINSVATYMKSYQLRQANIDFFLAKAKGTA